MHTLRTGGISLIIQSALSLEAVQARVDQILESDGGAREVLAYVASARGKGLRPSLVLLAFDLCGGTRFDEAINCAAGVELVHMASLIHDDIIDRSEFRRRQLTAHRKFGTQAAVLAGDHLFAAAFHLFAMSTNHDVSQVMTAVIQDMCSGEIGQLLSPARTEADYLDYIHKKTACLIGGCCRLGAILSDASKLNERYLKEFGESIGLAFQLTDDVLDYRGVEQVMGKEGGRDFAEGLWTLPTIRAYERGLIPSNWFASDFASVHAILEGQGVLEEVLQEASSHIRQAQMVLDRFPSSGSKAELAGILVSLTKRSW
ncbi:MAG TPA: polyprenyl synthetase family protein [Limnochordia bacterium]|nr:polyprenyl synthetase family protein [Limnochordia bacterium]